MNFLLLVFLSIVSYMFCDTNEVIICYNSFKPRFKNHSKIITLDAVPISDKEILLLTNEQNFSFISFPLNPLKGKVVGTFPATFIVTLKNAKIFSHAGYVLYGKENKILYDTLWDWEDLDDDIWSNDFEFPEKLQKINGTVAVIAQKGGRNYYHWMTEALPRIYMLVKSGIKYDYLYVPFILHEFQKVTLNMLGIDPDKIIQGESDTLLQAEQLIIPSMPSISTVSPLWVIDFLQNMFSNQKKNLCKKYVSKNIYVSRKCAEQRKITNEEELITLLKQYFDIVPVILEEFSVEEQAELFCNAEIIIAPHGAGLTNLVFAKPNTLVIEIFQYRLDETFWLLSQQLKLRHFCILGIPDEELNKLKDPKFLKEVGNSINLDLDLIKIEDSLKKIHFNLSQNDHFRCEEGS